MYVYNFPFYLFGVLSLLLLINVAVSATGNASMLLDHATVKAINEAKVHGIIECCVTKVLLILKVPATRDGQGSLQRLLVLPGREDTIDVGVVQPEHGLVGGVEELWVEVTVRRCHGKISWKGQAMLNLVEKHLRRLRSHR